MARKLFEPTRYHIKPDGTVEFPDAPSEEAKRVVLEHLARAREHEEHSRELWGDPADGPARMARLCAAFPSLHDVPGTDPWDASSLLGWLLGPAPTSGSRSAALFVLGVWNPQTDWNTVVADEFGRIRCSRCDGSGRLDSEGNPAPKDATSARRCPKCEGEGTYLPSLGSDGGRFDVFKAMAVWDAEHVEAFKMWVAYPFFP
jgi:hypothetical protein